MKYFRQYGMRIAVSIMSIVLAVFMAYMLYMPVRAVQMGTITELAAHVYENATADSNIVANVIMGYNFPILGEETDGDGNVWYFIETDTGVQGYVSAQVVIRVTDNAQNNDNNAGNTRTQTPASEPENENENNLPYSGKIQLLTMEVVNIREGSSINGEVVGKIPRGTTIDYIDVITNTSGEVWYEIEYEGIHGFVRQSTVREIEAPVQTADGSLPDTEEISAETIDIDRLIETARQYRNDNTAENSAPQQDVMEKTKPQPQTVYDSDLLSKEDTVEIGNRKYMPLFDTVILFSLPGIVLCALIIWRILKKMAGLYR